MSVLRDDFIGFTYNGKHSSELGIVRVSTGNRYEEGLLPVSTDKTEQVPGGDGTYFFDSTYTQRPIEINIAYDSLSEEQFRYLRILLGDKKIHDFIYDEVPYKRFKVKVNNTPTMQYICFDENDERVYKGEGRISFIAYFPFAYSTFKYLEDYADLDENGQIKNWKEDYLNGDEWIKSSKIKSKQFNKLDTFNTTTRKIKLWNAGDLETDYILSFNFPPEEIYVPEEFQISLDNDITAQLNLGKISRLGEDTGFRINSKLNLIEGYREINGEEFISGNVYNKFIKSGNFFKIPLEESYLSINGTLVPKDIKYSYLYY